MLVEFQTQKFVNADKNGANVTPAKLALNLKKEPKK